MYYHFDTYAEVVKFIEEHPEANLVGWPYGLSNMKYSVIIHIQNKRRGK